MEAMSSKNRSLWLALLALVVVACLALVARPSAVLPDKPLTEDGFYALAVARSVADGEGLTIDGQWTNGFQPLFTVLCAVPFLLSSDDLGALRLVLVLSAMVHLLAAVLFGLLVGGFAPAGEKWGLVLSMLVFFGSVKLITDFYNGLETGLVMALYLAAGVFYQRYDPWVWRNTVLLGALLGLLVLARIDAGFFAVLVGVSYLVLFKNRALGERVVRFVTVGAVSVLVASPWFLYNQVMFGSIMPTSGQQQQHFGLTWARATTALWAALMNLVPWLYFGPFEWRLFWGGVGVRAVALAALMAIAVRFCAGTLAAGEGSDVGAEGRRRTLHFGGLLLGHVAILFVWYTCYSTAMDFYSRYFVPASLLTVFVLAVLVHSLAARWKAGVAVLLAVMALGMLSLYHLPFIVRGNNFYQDGLPLVHEHVPDENVAVGAFQSGTFCFFRRNVVNLDGKVNAEVGKRMSFAERLDYLDRIGVRWVCDWEVFLRPMREHGDRWERVGSRGIFEIWRRREGRRPEGDQPGGVDGGSVAVDS